MGVASGRTFLGIWASEALAVGVSYSLIRIRQKPYQFSIGRYWRKADTLDRPHLTQSNVRRQVGQDDAVVFGFGRLPGPRLGR